MVSIDIRFFFLNVPRLQTTRQIGKYVLRFQKAFYVLVTAEAKNKSAVKTNVSENVLIVGMPVNMGSFGQKLSP